MSATKIEQISVSSRLTSVQRANAHGGSSSIHIFERSTVWLVDHTQVEDIDQLHHPLPWLLAEKVTHNFTVSAADGLVDRDVVGRITCGKRVSAQQRNGVVDTLIRCSKFIEG